MNRLRDIDRRWWAAIAVAVVVAGLVLYQTVFRGTSAECRPVREFLEFNTAQTKLIDAKQDPTAADYQAWADGLADRAAKVTDPTLASQAVGTAELAGQFAAKWPQLHAATDVPAGTQNAPPIAYEMAAINTQIGNGLTQLSKSCAD